MRMLYSCAEPSLASAWVLTSVGLQKLPFILFFPRSMILSWVNLLAVWYCDDSISSQYDTSLSLFYFIFTSQYDTALSRSPCSMILRSAQSQSPRNTAQSQSPRSMILLSVNLLAVWYCADSISSQYDTALSQSPRSMILRWVNILAVWYCAESISLQYEYDTALSQSPCCIIRHRVSHHIVWYCAESISS